MKALVLCVCLLAFPVRADFVPENLDGAAVIAVMACPPNMCGLVVKDGHKYLVVADQKGIVFIFDAEGELRLLYARGAV